jgi:CRP-like cAMP-binding protein
MPQVLNADHRANRLLAALEPDDFAALRPHLEIVHLTRGQVLYDVGDPLRFSYFPHDAIVSLVNVMEDGGSVEVAVFGREGVFGLLAEIATREAFGHYIVQMSGSASRITFERLNEVRNACPTIRRLITNYGQALLVHTFQSVSCNAVHPVEARCCRWILNMHDRMEQDTLPLTHEFLVTRTLQTAGLIEQARGSITVIDRGGLEETACECYRKIRQIYERLLPGTFPRAPSDRGSSTPTGQCGGPVLF